MYKQTNNVLVNNLGHKSLPLYAFKKGDELPSCWTTSFQNYLFLVFSRSNIVKFYK